MYYLWAGIFITYIFSFDGLIILATRPGDLRREVRELTETLEFHGIYP